MAGCERRIDIGHGAAVAACRCERQALTHRRRLFQAADQPVAARFCQRLYFWVVTAGAAEIAGHAALDE